MAVCQQPACYVPTVWGQAANKTFFFSIYFDVHGFFYYSHNRVIDASMRII